MASRPNGKPWPPSAAQTLRRRCDEQLRRHQRHQRHGSHESPSAAVEHDHQPPRPDRRPFADVDGGAESVTLTGTARCWPRSGAARCGYGMRPTGSRSAAPWPAAPVRRLCSVQPGRHDPGHRRHRRHSTPVGRGNRSADRNPLTIGTRNPVESMAVTRAAQCWHSLTLTEQRGSGTSAYLSRCAWHESVWGLRGWVTGWIRTGLYAGARFRTSVRRTDCPPGEYVHPSRESQQRFVSRSAPCADRADDISARHALSGLLHRIVPRQHQQNQIQATVLFLFGFTVTDSDSGGYAKVGVNTLERHEMTRLLRFPQPHRSARADNLIIRARRSTSAIARVSSWVIARR